MWTTTPARTRWAAYTGMVLVAGAGMVIFPLLPALQDELGIGTASIGLIAAAGFGAAVLTELVLAPQADRGRARALASLGVALLAGSLLWSALADSAWELVAARAVGGMGSGAFLPAAGAVLIRQDPARAGERLGRLSTAELAGIALGPLVAAALLELLPPDAVFGLTALLTGLGVLPVLVWLREGAAPAPVAGRPPALGIDLLRSRAVVGAVLLTVAVMIPVGAYDAIWPRFMTDIGAGELLVGLSYTLFALPFMLIAAPAGKLADRIGGPAVFLRGIAVLLGTVLLYAVLGDPWVVTGVGVVESTGQALAFVGAAAAMAQAVSPLRAAAGQGLARSLGLLAATATAAGAGWAYAVGGAPALFGGTVVLVALTAAAAWALLRSRAAVEEPEPEAACAH